MCTEYGFTGFHSGPYWDMVIILRFDPGLRLPPDIREMMPPEIPIEYQPRADSIQESLPPLYGFEPPDDEDDLVHRLILRRVDVGRFEDLANKLPKAFLEALWGKAVTPEMEEHLASLSAAFRLTMALRHSRAVLELPGVSAIDLKFYVNRLDPFLPHDRYVLRIVRDDMGYLELQVREFPLDDSAARESLSGIAGAIDWPNLGWLYPSPGSSDDDIPRLGPAKVHDAGFVQQFFIDPCDLESLGDLYLDLADDRMTLQEALQARGWTLETAMELSMRAVQFEAFTPLMRRGPDGMEPIEEMIPYVRGREAFWRAAGPDAIPFLTHRIDDDCYEEVVEVAPMASVELCVPLFRWLLNAWAVRPVLFEAIMKHRILALARDLRDAMEHTAFGWRGRLIGYSCCEPHEEIMRWTLTVFQALQVLLAPEEFSSLALSAYFSQPEDQQGTWAFDRPIIRASSLPPRDCGKDILSGYSLDEEPSPSSSTSNWLEERIRGVHQSLVSTIQNTGVLTQILSCGELSDAMRECVQKRIIELSD